MGELGIYLVRKPVAFGGVESPNGGETTEANATIRDRPRGEMLQETGHVQRIRGGIPTGGMASELVRDDERDGAFPAGEWPDVIITPKGGAN